MSDVILREITQDNFRGILRLEVAPEQKEFVAENAHSIAEAHYEPLAWIRGVYAEDTAVGFVMLRDDPEKPQYYLWRFMIAAEHQGKGYGKAALDRVVEYVRTRPGATELLCSYVPGEAGPGASIGRGSGTPVNLSGISWTSYSAWRSRRLATTPGGGGPPCTSSSRRRRLRSAPCRWRPLSPGRPGLFRPPAAPGVPRKRRARRASGRLPARPRDGSRAPWRIRDT